MRQAIIRDWGRESPELPFQFFNSAYQIAIGRRGLVVEFGVEVTAVWLVAIGIVVISILVVIIVIVVVIMKDAGAITNCIVVVAYRDWSVYYEPMPRNRLALPFKPEAVVKDPDLSALLPDLSQDECIPAEITNIQAAFFVNRL
ncbi:hypothetical protein CNMCM5623_003879 [Aspergillus felis]|uniref:Uncharacterized protein n=1 Tax=Aspergillus felis TaxID=1287682 RepID=A0A8H6PPS3_9EURO|nr:hypothetical protein CNMCM5623_003879 [Aspergillus felis]